MAYCSRCGVEMQTDAAFCSACGHTAENKARASRRFRLPKLVVILVVVAAVLIIGSLAIWLAYSPAWTLRGMADAVRDEDPERLASYIDFEALRSQLHEEALREFENVPEGQGEFEALGQVFGSALAAAMIDRYVSPSGVRLLLENERASENLEDAFRDGARSYDRRSMSRFSIENDGAELVFERRFLSWRLVAFEGDETAIGELDSDEQPNRSVNREGRESEDGPQEDLPWDILEDSAAYEDDRGSGPSTAYTGREGQMFLALIGRWTLTGNCSDAFELESDGSYIWGDDSGTWHVSPDGLTLQGHGDEYIYGIEGISDGLVLRDPNGEVLRASPC